MSVKIVRHIDGIPMYYSRSLWTKQHNAHKLLITDIYPVPLVQMGSIEQIYVHVWWHLSLSPSLSHTQRFLLQFSIDKSTSVLNVVETNPFRHLNHLSLKFVPASDTYLKKYLAECLLSLKVCPCVSHLWVCEKDLVFYPDQKSRREVCVCVRLLEKVLAVSTNSLSIGIFSVKAYI